MLLATETMEKKIIQGQAQGGKFRDMLKEGNILYYSALLLYCEHSHLKKIFSWDLGGENQ